MAECGQTHTTDFGLLERPVGFRPRSWHTNCLWSREQRPSSRSIHHFLSWVAEASPGQTACFFPVWLISRDVIVCGFQTGITTESSASGTSAQGREWWILSSDRNGTPPPLRLDPNAIKDEIQRPVIPLSQARTLYAIPVH